MYITFFVYKRYGICSLFILCLKLLSGKCVTYDLGDLAQWEVVYKHVWWIKTSKVTYFKSLILHSKSNEMFEESSKSRGVFKTQASIYDGAFLWVYLPAYYFS